MVDQGATLVNSAFILLRRHSWYQGASSRWTVLTKKDRWK